MVLYKVLNYLYWSFHGHKVYMKIQEVMMKQLGCITWEQVTEDYPLTSSYKALSEYIIAFKYWVSIGVFHKVFLICRPCIIILRL